MSESNIIVATAKFLIGDLVHHKLFNYRGVIVDIDPKFQLTDDWYQAMARSRPPKNEPWYQVLVNDTTTSSYVAEQNLELDKSGEAINHPMVDEFFLELKNGRYVTDEKIN